MARTQFSGSSPFPGKICGSNLKWLNAYELDHSLPIHSRLWKTSSSLLLCIAGPLTKKSGAIPKINPIPHLLSYVVKGSQQNHKLDALSMMHKILEDLMGQTLGKSLFSFFDPLSDCFSFISKTIRVESKYLGQTCVRVPIWVVIGKITAWLVAHSNLPITKINRHHCAWIE